MKIKTIVNLHLGRERLDVLISVVIPFVLMVESGYANGWVFASGSLSPWDVNTYLALFRGFFLEALIFAMFKLVRILFLKGDRKYWLVALLPLSIGIITMIVSAGLNIGWANRSGEMQAIVSMVSQFIPDFVLSVFKMGIGLIFPIAVGAFALLDVGHLVEEILHASAHMDDRAARVQVAEQHRSMWLEKQTAKLKDVEDQYEAMAAADVQNMVNRVRNGDYSFGVNDAPSRVTPMQTPQLAPPPPYPQIAGPAPITAQFQSAPFPPSGNTQLLQYPPTQPMKGR